MAVICGIPETLDEISQREAAATAIAKALEQYDYSDATTHEIANEAGRLSLFDEADWNHD